MSQNWSDKQTPSASYRITSPDHVTVLMATYDGARFLVEQLNSLTAQSHKNWSLIASDDGSTDRTVEILRDFTASHRGNPITVLRGPGNGAAQNFLSLLRASGSSPFVAFADQDDVWFPEKLGRAIRALEGRSGPALYGARTKIFETSLSHGRASPLNRHLPSFGNALIQNFAGGNTMVMNRKASELLQGASRLAGDVFAHDWWCYQMVTGIGGTAIYDPKPCLGYRQHEQNLIGSNDRFTDGLRRLGSVCTGEWKLRIRTHLEALTKTKPLLTPQARNTLGALQDLSEFPALARPRMLAKAGIYHQRRRGHVALCLAAIAGRI